MIYKAVEVIWIFSADGRAGGTRGTGIEGTIRGPRGPKKSSEYILIAPFSIVHRPCALFIVRVHCSLPVCILPISFSYWRRVTFQVQFSCSPPPLEGSLGTMTQAAAKFPVSSRIAGSTPMLSSQCPPYT